MCGASHEQKEMYAKQSVFYDTLTAAYKESFGKSEAIFNTLTAGLKPIFDKGPSQRGFSDAERTAIDTEITDNTARNFEHAKAALNNDLNARMGSDFIPSGVDAQIQSGLSATEAATRSTLQNQAEQADWATGRDLWARSAAGLAGVAAGWNPTGSAAVANNAGSAASQTATDIAAASNSIWSSVIGGLSGIAGAAVGGFTGGIGKGPAAPSSFPATPGGQ